MTPNYGEAARCLQKAANQGHARAQYFLGVLRKEGAGEAQSDQVAMRWWQKAAVQGDTDAMRQLGAIRRRRAVLWRRVSSQEGS